MSTFELHQGDCVTAMRTMPPESVDSIVTDPPYGISFMGKKWDHDVPSVEVWAECLRILKPGGHLLAFAGTRTQHRMAVRIEDAGFEVRDMIAWVYSTGFPKSRDVSDAMERYQAGEVAQRSCGAVRLGVYQVTAFLREARIKAGWTNRQIDELFGTSGMAGHWTTAASQPAVPSVRQWEILKGALGFGDEMDALVAELSATEKPQGSTSKGGNEKSFLSTLHHRHSDKAAGPWGTALKPAMEPITVARKPPSGSVTANVTMYGTGALNIEGCRVGDTGRWPANIIHDGSQDVLDNFGGAARFFHCAKASKKDRGEGNTHPTVKPTDLMAYLCRMVTPPGGVVLDPFMGSGSTGKAATREGFRFIGIDMAAEYVEIARHRLTAANDNHLNHAAVA